jgi:hypothetical protein
MITKIHLHKAQDPSPCISITPNLIISLVKNILDFFNPPKSHHFLDTSQNKTKTSFKLEIFCWGITNSSMAFSLSLALDK